MTQTIYYTFTGKFILLIAFLSVSTIGAAQCLKGNCDNGTGTKQYPDNSRFDGVFRNGQKVCGNYYYASGNKWEGCFENNLRHGHGTFTYQNGEKFIGHFQADNKVFGEYHYKSGNIYTGTFENNLPEGFGSMTYPDGRRWEGNWTAGKKQWGTYISFQRDSLVLSSDSMTRGTTASFSNIKGERPRLFSVIVGIAGYPLSSSPLQFCDDDAIAFHSYLSNAMPKEMASGQTALLVNEQATSANILSAVSNIFSQAGPNDILIFFFSGHGAPGQFIPYDHFSSTVAHEDIKRIFKQSQGKYRICIADACYSGSIGEAGTNTAAVAASSEKLRDARLAVIMSSKPYQTSAESGRLRQGLFTYYLLQGWKGRADVNGDKYVTAGELFLYTRNKVKSASSGEQIPVVFGNNLDRIPLARFQSN